MSTAVFDRPRTVVAKWEWALLALIILALAWSVLRIIGIGDILGHDEAVYATRARSWAQHTETTSWFAHRSPGIAVLGVPVLSAGGGPALLRAIGLLFAIMLAGGVWALARRVGGPVAAPIATAGVVFISSLLDHSARFLTDLPAAALIVWLMWVIVDQAQRPALSMGLLWCAPLAAAAVYIRMGAALPLALVAIAGTVTWPKVVMNGWRTIALTVGGTAVLLSVHMLGAIRAFGTPWGRILHTARLTRADEAGAALTQYVSDFPNELAGIPAGMLMTVGLIGLPMLLLARKRRDEIARGSAFVLLVGVGHMVGMGVTSQPEVRFVFLPIVLFCVAGGVAVGGVVSYLGKGFATATAAGLAAVFTVIGLVSTAPAVIEQRHDADGAYDAMRAAATQVLAHDGTCAVATSYVPQFEWLTSCPVFAFPPEDPTSVLKEVDADNAFMLLLRRGKRQPEGEDLQILQSRAQLVAHWDLREGRLGSADLYRVE